MVCYISQHTLNIMKIMQRLKDERYLKLTQHQKIHDWKTILSFWGFFQGRTVSFRECNENDNRISKQ